MKPTQEQVLAWAQLSGIDVHTWMGVPDLLLLTFATLAYEAGQEYMKWDGIHSCHPDCQRPACVHTRKAVEAEREACAKVCDAYIGADPIAAAIRARREQ